MKTLLTTLILMLGLLAHLAHSQQIVKKEMAEKAWKEFFGEDILLAEIKLPKINFDSCNIVLPIFGIGEKILEKWHIENIENIKLDLRAPKAGYVSINQCKIKELLTDYPDYLTQNEIIWPDHKRANFMELVEIITLLKILKIYEYEETKARQQVLLWCGEIDFNVIGPKNSTLIEVYYFNFEPYINGEENKLGTIMVSRLPAENVVLGSISEKYLFWYFRDEHEDESLEMIKTYFMKTTKDENVYFFSEPNLRRGFYTRDFVVSPMPISILK